MKTISIKKGDFNKLLKKQSWYYKNDNLTEENFPVTTVRTENWKLIKLDKYISSEDCLKLVKDAGCTPANAMELALFRENHPDQWPDNKYTWIIALGQLWKDSDGDHRVPYVGRYSDGDWEFCLGFFEDDWDAGHCLLAFATSPSDAETLDVRKPLSSLTLTLLNGEEAIVDADEYEKLNHYTWHVSSHGYACRVENKKTIYMHQILNQTPEGFQTDHINRNRLDNRKANLRTVTWSENQLNTGLRVDSKTGEKGISKKGVKWQVHLRRNKKRYFLGNFDSLKEAVKVRDSFDLQPSGTQTLEKDVDSLALAIETVKNAGFKIIKEF